MATSMHSLEVRTLADVVSRHAGPDAISRAVSVLGDMRERHSQLEACALEVDTRNMTMGTHAATMELFGRESPSQAAKRKVETPLDGNSPIGGSTNPYPSLRNHLQAAGRHSYSGTPSQGNAEQRTPVPPSPTPPSGEKPRPRPTTVARMQSSGMQLRIPRQSDSGSTASEPYLGRRSEPGTASPQRTSMSGAAPSPSRPSTSGAAPPRRSSTSGAARRRSSTSGALDSEPIEVAISQDAILARVERRFSTSGSQSLSRLSRASESGSVLGSASRTLFPNGKLSTSGRLMPSGGLNQQGASSGLRVMSTAADEQVEGQQQQGGAFHGVVRPPSGRLVPTMRSSCAGQVETGGRGVPSPRTSLSGGGAALAGLTVQGGSPLARPAPLSPLAEVLLAAQAGSSGSGHTRPVHQSALAEPAAAKKCVHQSVK